MLSEQVASEANAMRRELKRLHADGRIARTDAAGLDALARSVRSAGVTAQKLVRLAAGTIKLRPEPVDLTKLARELVLELRPAVQRRRAELRLDIGPAQVHADGSLAQELARAALEWALGFSNCVVLGVTSAMAGDVRLVVRGDRAVPAPPGAYPTSRRAQRLNDSLRWFQLRQLAAIANLKVMRSAQDTWELASVEFPRSATVEGIAAVELIPGAYAQTTLDDARVLIMVRNRKVRQAIMRILLSNGLEPTVADGIEDARRVCAARKPRAIVSCHEQPRPWQIRQALAVDEARCALVEVTQAPPSFHASGFSGHEWVRIGRERLERELIPALLFEIAQQG